MKQMHLRTVHGSRRSSEPLYLQACGEIQIITDISQSNRKNGSSLRKRCVTEVRAGMPRPRICRRPRDRYLIRKGEFPWLIQPGDLRSSMRQLQSNNFSLFCKKLYLMKGRTVFVIAHRIVYDPKQ